MIPLNLTRLCKELDYTFTNINYLKQALTHRSVRGKNNERFEFVGDSILNFVITMALDTLLPQSTEGELSRLRAFLVKGESLSEIALEINLGDSLYLGPGELKSGGFRRLSILADALEAIFAAIYFDGGLEAAKKTILKLYQTRLDSSNINNCFKDSKTLLQEYLQSKKLALPQYELVKNTGSEHDQIFFVTCTVPGIKLTLEGEASTRRKAEQIVAKLYLKQLKSIIKK